MNIDYATCSACGKQLRKPLPKKKRIPCGNHRCAGTIGSSGRCNYCGKTIGESQTRFAAGADNQSEENIKEPLVINFEKPKQARVPFGTLLECGYLQPGQSLFFVEKGVRARILSNGHLKCGDLTGSIHGVARALKDGAPVNGWDMWFYKDENGNKIEIDELRKTFRNTGVKHD